MRALFTCEGTAGHVDPAVALTQMPQAHNSNCEVLFVGTGGGMETRLVPREGYPIETVTITSSRRSSSPASIGHNVRTLLNMNRSRGQANAILDRFQPDLVVGIGGYASLPVMRTAAKWGIPTAIHESNIVPGLTTKTLPKVVDVVMMDFEESRSHYNDPGRAVVTGTPMRTDFSRYTRKETRAELGLTDDRPLVSSMWGNLGTEVMDCQMTECITLGCRDGAPFHRTRGTDRDYRAVLDVLQGNGLVDHPEVDVRRYIYNMPLVMTVVDLVLCRTRVSAITETAAITKSAVLVPSPNVMANHQTKDARVLANAGDAVLLSEGGFSGGKLYVLMTGLPSNVPRWEAMNRALQDMAMPDMAEQIYQILVRLVEKRINWTSCPPSV